MEINCKKCGMIYTLKEGNLPEGMMCSCKNTEFKILETRKVISPLEAQ